MYNSHLEWVNSIFAIVSFQLRQTNACEKIMISLRLHYAPFVLIFILDMLKFSPSFIPTHSYTCKVP